MKTMKRWVTVATVAVIAVTVGSTSVLGATLHSIGVLDWRDPSSAVYAISTDGVYAVGYSNAPNATFAATPQQPIIWTTSNSLIQLANPSSTSSQATGVVVRPIAGKIGIGARINTQMYYYASLLSDLAGGTWTSSPVPRGAGPYNTAALRTTTPEQWFICGTRPGSVRDYVQGVDGGPSLDHRNSPYACSSHGMAGNGNTAGYDIGNPSSARRAVFMNANNGTVQKVIPGGSGVLSEAFGISLAANILSGYDATNATNNQAFIWKTADLAMTLIGTLAGDTQSTAIAVNLIGGNWIAAGYSSDGTTERAVIWDTTGTWDATGQPKVLSDLLTALGVDVSAWTRLSRATTMSGDGRIVAGYGVWAADGSTRGFYASLDNPAINDAPEVNAGVYQEILMPVDYADLDGTVTDDGLPVPPGAVTTQWSVASGPGAVTFDDDSAVDTRATFSTAGIYWLKLTANDGSAKKSDWVKITVNYTLTTGVVGGNGTLAPPSGPQPGGAVVNLTSTPDPGYVVLQWTGTDNDTLKTATNTVTMTSDKTVTVEFETDSDGDGVGDSVDGCPLDPNKIAPGQCGCGTPDIDTDNDGTADCIDGCPLDPNKIAPGVCGCGTPDTDTDGDGVADCIDNCPTVPNPGQEDSNSNGIGDACDAPVITAAVSSKVHGAAGTFTIDVAASGAVECRKDGSTEIVVTFNVGIQLVGPTPVVVTSGIISSLTLSGGSSEILTIAMSGGTDATPETVTFPGVANATDASKLCTGSLCFGLLIGDVNGDLTVNIFDLVKVRNELNLAVTGTNFRTDVNFDGAINIFDLVTLRNNLNKSVAACP